LVNSVVLEIQETGNTDYYTEVSRLIVGNYWTPTYNTGYGMELGLKDLSTAERNEAGDLITNNGAMYSTLKFDLNWLAKQDRIELNRLIRTLGQRKPLFVSLFPDNTTDYGKEMLYQIYGKFVQLSPISHPVLDMYASTVEIEEI
jgi:hypothetical protein